MNAQRDAANADFRKEVTANPKSSDAWLRLGQAYNEGRQFDRAIEAFREAVALAQESPVALAALATALTNAGKADEAVPIARKAVSIAPADDRTHGVLAFALVETGNVQEALQEADKARELAPHEVFVQMIRSEALRRLGRLREAYDAAKSALEAHPDEPAVLKLAARAALGAKRFTAAEAAARHLLEIDPQADQGHLLLGLALSNQTEQRQAEQTFRTGLELRPDDPDLLNGLAFALAQQGRYQEAETPARKAYSKSNLWYVVATLAVVLIGVADLYKDDDLFAEARDLGSKALGLAGKDVDPDEVAKLYLQRGYAHTRLNETEEAREDFRRSIAQASALSNVSLAAGRNLRRLSQSILDGKPLPRWLGHAIAIAAFLMVLLATGLLVFRVLESGAYATIVLSCFAFVFVGYLLPSITRLKIGVVELERIAGPVPLPTLTWLS